MRHQRGPHSVVPEWPPPKCLYCLGWGVKLYSLPLPEWPAVLAVDCTPQVSCPRAADPTAVHADDQDDDSAKLYADDHLLHSSAV